MTSERHARPASWRSPLRLALASALAVAWLGAACGPEFDPYFQVKTLRVMAIGADNPSVAPAGQATLEVLAFEPGDAPLSYRWEWCPLSAGETGDFECAISEEDFTAALAGTGVEVPPFVLGTGQTATFTYPNPPEIVAFLCEQIEGQELPSFFNPPDCSRGLEVLIKVTVSGGGQEVVAVRQLELLTGPDAPPNLNPSFDNLRIIKDGDTDEQAQVFAQGPVVLERDQVYILKVDVDEASSEPFLRNVEGEEPQETSEILNLSWFVTGGEIDEDRTGFIPDFNDFGEMQRNVLITPTAKDHPAEDFHLFLVLRDERGGVAWIEAEATLR